LICHPRAKIRAIDKIKRNHIQKIKNHQKKEVNVVIPAHPAIQVTQANRKVKD